MNVFELAERNQQKAWEIIEDTHIIQIWEGIGAKSESSGLIAYWITDEAPGY